MESRERVVEEGGDGEGRREGEEGEEEEEEERDDALVGEEAVARVIGMADEDGGSST
jgi:hypothetical protein